MSHGRLCSGCFPQPVCEVNLIRCLPGKGLMGALLVEEAKVGLKPLPQISNAVVGVQVDMLVLDRAPEPFDKYVVHPSPLAIHADLDLVGLPINTSLLKVLRRPVESTAAFFKMSRSSVTRRSSVSNFLIRAA